MQPLLLDTAHAARGGRLGDLRGRRLVLSYGDLHAEYRAALGEAALADLSYRDQVRVVGPDAESFLQGMVTQDLKPLPPLGAAYATLLTAKGAMVSDARILREEDGFTLDLEPGLGEAVLAFLGKFLISEDAELQQETERGQLGLYGPWALEVLRRLSTVEGEALAHGLAHGEGRRVSLAGTPVTLLAWNRVGVPGFELLLPAQKLETVYQALASEAGVRPIGFEAMEVLRVEAGLPRYGQDMVETTIPLEARLERAISYTKGCYIGQEVIARATYRGHMNRHLCGLLLGDEPLAPSTALFAGEKKVGWVTSVVRSLAQAQAPYVALGYVHRDHQEPGTELTVEGRAAKVTVASLPLRPFPGLEAGPPSR